MAACSQCGKPAMYNRGGHLLCLDCNWKVEQMWQSRDAALKQQMNFLLDQAEALTGMYGVMPRYKVAKPVIHQGPMNFHNINVDRSVVGAINTGNVKKMEVALNNIHAKNENAELEKALKEFTEAVLSEKSLPVEKKDDIVEQLSVLAAQAALQKESRVTIVMKALVTSIGASIPTALIEHWDKIKTMLGF